MASSSTSARGDTRFSKNGVGFELRYGKDFADKGTFFDKDGFKYIRLQESDYGFNFFNTTAQDLDVIPKIDGKSVGKFRVRPGQEWLVKRGSSSDTGWLFVAEKSSIAASRGVVSGAKENGGLQFEFRLRKAKLASRLFAHDGHRIQLECSGGREVRKGRMESAEEDEDEEELMESTFQSAPAVIRARPSTAQGGKKCKNIFGESGSRPEVCNERKQSKMTREEEGGEEESKAPTRAPTRDRSGATIEGRKTDQTFNDTESITDSDLDYDKSFSESFRMVVAGVPLPMPALPPRID